MNLILIEMNIDFRREPALTPPEHRFPQCMHFRVIIIHAMIVATRATRSGLHSIDTRYIAR